MRAPQVFHESEPQRFHGSDKINGPDQQSPTMALH